MKYVKAEATNKKDNYKAMTRTAFGLAKFQPSEAEHTLTAPVTGTVKEMKYIKGNTMVRFLMFDRPEPDYLFQYHVWELSEEEIQEELQKHEKRIADSLAKQEEPAKKKKKTVKKETAKKKIVEQPIMIEEVETPEVVLEPEKEEELPEPEQSTLEEQTQKTLDAWVARSVEIEEGEEGDLFSEATPEELEAMGQETLALF